VLKNMALRILTEPRRKKFAAAVIGKHGRFYRAIGANAEFHRWLKAQGNFPYFSHRSELYRYVSGEVVRNAPIDYLEFGVRYGDSILAWAALNAHPNSRFVGFDSFEGLPEDWVSTTGTAAKGAFSVEGKIPETKDERICFVKGWFSDTLRPFLKSFATSSRMIVHNDADLYSSTMFTLATLDPILPLGSILLFDEFANPLHEWAAFQDYVSAFGRKFQLLGAAGDYYTQVALELK
jgi:O-methyltransferase